MSDSISIDPLDKPYRRKALTCVKCKKLIKMIVNEQGSKYICIGCWEVFE